MHINKAVVAEFLRFGVPISTLMIIVKKYGENSATPLYQMIMVSLVVSFLLSYYRQSLKPSRLAKETMRTLNGLEELGFEFKEGRYIRRFRNREISVKYKRGSVSRYPAMLISLKCYHTLWDLLKSELKNSQRTNYHFESGFVTIEHEVDDMRTFLAETKEQIARMVTILETAEHRLTEC